MSAEAMLLGLEHSTITAATGRRRARTGAVGLPVDDDTAARFHAKCAPFVDDRGHRWWLGAIDGGADHSGGYGRVQAGRGHNAGITTAHRFAWTLAHGPVPQGLVLRHRCDEPLCIAVDHLELGTPADNSWDALERPLRPADLDTRGSAARSRAIRMAVPDVLGRHDADPVALGAAVRAAMGAGDPDRNQLLLWSAASDWAAAQRAVHAANNRSTCVGRCISSLRRYPLPRRRLSSMANRVYLEGNITRDTTLVPTRGGTPMAFLHIAANRQWTGADGKSNQDTAYPSVVTFGAAAEYAARSGQKGRPVVVEGSLRTRKHDTADGPRYELEVVADTVRIFESRAPSVDAPAAEADHAL